MKLIVRNNRNTVHQALAIFPIIGVSLLCYYVVTNRLFRSGYIGAAPAVIISAIALLFFACAIWIFLYAHSTEPLAILDETGLWVKHFGRITWSNIREISPYRYKNSPIIMIAIYPYDRQNFSKDITFRGRCILFWSKITGTPPIIIYNTDVPYMMIINFAQQFLKNAS